MRAVGRVEIRAEHGFEIRARAVAHLVEEPRLGVIAFPIRGDGNLAAVANYEAGDVDRIRGGMLAHRRMIAATDDASAGKGAEMIDTHHLTAQMSRRGGL